MSEYAIVVTFCGGIIFGVGIMIYMLMMSHNRSIQEYQKKDSDET
jgi:hypothetical protein